MNKWKKGKWYKFNSTLTPRLIFVVTHIDELNDRIHANFYPPLYDKFTYLSAIGTKSVELTRLHALLLGAKL